MNERLDKLKKGNWTNVIQNTHMVCTIRRMEPCILDHRIQILEMGNLKKKTFLTAKSSLTTTFVMPTSYVLLFQVLC